MAAQPDVISKPYRRRHDCIHYNVWPFFVVLLGLASSGNIDSLTYQPPTLVLRFRPLPISELPQELLIENGLISPPEDSGLDAVEKYIFEWAIPLQDLAALAPESLGGLTGEELLQLAREQLCKLRPEEVAGLLRERTLGDIRAELQAAEERAAAEKAEAEQRERDEIEERRRHTFVPEQEYTADALRELLLRQAALKACSGRTSTAKAETDCQSRQPQVEAEASGQGSSSTELSRADGGASAKKGSEETHHSAAHSATSTLTDHGKSPGDDTQQHATATVTHPHADSDEPAAKRIRLRRMGNSSEHTTPVIPNQEPGTAPAAVETATEDIAMSTNTARSEGIMTEPSSAHLATGIVNLDIPVAPTERAARDLGGKEEQVAGQLPGKGRKVCMGETLSWHRMGYSVLWNMVYVTVLGYALAT